MDSSQLTNYRKAQSQFMYYVRLNKRGAQDQANLQTGAPSFFLKGRMIIQSGMPVLTSPTYNYSMNDSILQAFELFLRWIVVKGFGPTATARVLYMWFMAVAAPWNWVATQNKLSGTHDTWNFNQQTLLSDPMKVFIWTNHAMVDTFASLFTGYDISILLTQERSIFSWTEQQQLDAITSIRQEEIGLRSGRRGKRGLCIARGTDRQHILPSNLQSPKLSIRIYNSKPILLFNPHMWTPPNGHLSNSP